MDCADFLQGYSEYDDSLLPTGEVEAFRRHLASCASCRRYDRVLRKGRMVARQAPGPEPSESFVPDLQRRLWVDAPGSPLRVRNGRHRVPSGAPGLGGATGPMAAGGAVVAALIATVLLVHEPAPISVPLEPAGPPPLQAASPGGLHVHGEGGSRALPLPADGGSGLGGWAAARVDHSDASTYSPLVTGPPAYRADRVTFTSPSPPMTLD